MSNREYLGDSVYAEVENEMVKLTTDNGYGPSNTIYLEERTFCALINYVTRYCTAPVENPNPEK